MGFSSTSAGDALSHSFQRHQPFVLGGEIVILVIDENSYEMPTEAVTKILLMAKSYIPKGIYAVEDDGYVELKNETYDTAEQLRDAVIRYRMKGLRVHCNL